MDSKSTPKSLQSWQEQYPFALANYFWVAPSGKRICVVREFGSYDQRALDKYRSVEPSLRLNFERVEFWQELLGLIKKEKYPQDQIAACDHFADEVFKSLWSERDESESLNFFLAAWPLLEVEKTHSWLKELDFEVFTLLAYRCSLAVLFELIFGSRSFDIAIENVQSYLALCSRESAGIDEFYTLNAIKHNEVPQSFEDVLVFKRLDNELGGRWNELTSNNLFFYSLNLIQFPTKYPSKSQTLRDHVLKALEESGVPNAQEFLKSFESKWMKEANVS